jgi:hypothetical protein
MRIRRALVPLAVVGVLGLAACGGDDATDTVDTTSTTASAGTDSTTGAASTGTVSANDASTSEIAAALDAAGVPNAERWADEIVEYRPYPTEDPDFAKLRGELAKYNPGDGVVDQIVAVLTP